MTRHEIEIFAPPEKVWDWLTRVDLWADWRNDISGSRWLTEEGPGGTFKWRHRKVFGVTARVQSWHEMREMGWVSNSWRATIRQVIRLKGDFRRTTVTADTSVEGSAVGLGLLRAVFGSQVNRTNEIWLGSLKTKLESEKPRGRSAQGPGPGTRRSTLPSRDPRLRG